MARNWTPKLIRAKDDGGSLHIITCVWSTHHVVQSDAVNVSLHKGNWRAVILASFRNYRKHLSCCELRQSRFVQKTKTRSR